MSRIRDLKTFRRTLGNIAQLASHRMYLAVVVVVGGGGKKVSKVLKFTQICNGNHIKSNT